MKKTRIVGLDSAKMRKNMLDIVIAEQNRRLVEYAEQRIILLGDAIRMYHSSNDMDNTGNLLDSLCWGVLYNGKYVARGFYRDQKATMSAVLHEWWKGGEFRNKKSITGWESASPIDLPEIWGHQLAEQYLNKQEGKDEGKGWRIFFAILAPYWGYWEKGFSMKGNGGWGGRFIQFAVMSQFRDIVSSQLKPMKFRIKIHVEKYTDTGLMKTARRTIRKRERESNKKYR